MRKFIYSIVLAAGLSGAITSCSGFLDQTPTNAVAASESLQNLSDAGVACNGFYTPLKYYSMYGTVISVFGDMRADILYPSKQAKSYATVYQLDYDETQNSYFGSLWGGYYEVINRCNTFLENVDPLYLTISSSDKATLDNYVAEAHAVMGLCYFDLARFYGSPYLKDNGASLGAVLLDGTISTSEALEMKRSTVAQTYQRAIDELNEALPALKKSKNTGHLNYWAAKALLARIYLYMGKNSEALSAAQEVINSGVYALVDRANYKSYWAAGDGEKESVFELLISLKGDIDGDGGFNTIYHCLYFEDNGGQSIVPTKKWREMFSGDEDTDIRYSMLEEYTWTGGAKDMWLRKFLGNQELGFTFRRNSPKVIRMSDVYLMAAEAAVKSGNSEAANYLHAVRSRRVEGAEKIENPTLDDILTERAKEFIGEGHRFFDLMRNNKRITHDYDYDSQDYVGAEPYKSDGKADFDWSYYKVVLPIAATERGIYPGLEQNPGYKN